jgi:TyrR family helix-turn-helix protein
MRIELIGENRVGITQEVLACLSQHNLDLAAVEVVAGYIYLNIPQLETDRQQALFSLLMNVPGISQIRRIEWLPNERRRLHLDALLSSLPDPVFAVDSSGRVLSANRAATIALDTSESNLISTHIEGWVKSGNGGLLESSMLEKEVTLAGQPYWLEQIAMVGPTQSDRMLILQAPNRLGHQVSRVHMGERSGFNAIIGQSEALNRVKEQARRFAAIPAPLLIQGETGTGKELFARAVHLSSPWHEAPFLALNCAALPENLVESELFGYAPGAFSGASRGGKPGLLELADGGTAFLDEIGEMSPYVQAKLLRFIQDGSFRRVGGKEERRVNVRVVCATHRNLQQSVKAGHFREDLMYRLNVLNLELPSLRERPADIAPLSDLFVTRAREQIGCPPTSLTREARTLLSRHPWPGNVRQLENLLFRTVALHPGKTLGTEELQQSGLDTEELNQDNEPENWKTAQATFEKDLLSRMIKSYPSTRKLARQLGVSHTTIADKLRAYDIKTDA